jgi:hypothetical protein
MIHTCPRLFSLHRRIDHPLYKGASGGDGAPVARVEVDVKTTVKRVKKSQKRCLFLAETCWNEEKELRDDRKSFEKTFRVVSPTISKVGNSCNQGETGFKKLSKWAHNVTVDEQTCGEIEPPYLGILDRS